ncbi:DUF6776 family protein [Allohahella marinimesophila]|uniref:Uncharacterized protein n=1 Tax=Allohahella marinimesophila TaxID=1054972 RepID=A0ABP7P5A6_9GAMM
MKDRKALAKEKLVVAPQRPENRLRNRVFSWLAISIALGGGLLVGWMTAASTFQYSETTAARALDSLQDAQARILELTQTYEAMNRSAEIDRITAAESRAVIARLEDRLDQLTEDVTFYKSIMAPSDTNKGLQVKDFSLKPTGEPRTFTYRLVLTQVADNERYAEGVVAVSIQGTRDVTRRPSRPSRKPAAIKGATNAGSPSDEEILSLRDLTGSEELGIRFKFRYFQNIEGKFVLPEHFEPEQVQVVAQAKGARASKAEQTFPWNPGA